MKADIIRSVRTADGYRYDVHTDGLIMGMRESVNRIQLGREALFAFIELVSLFDRDELDGLIRRIRKAEKKLGPNATADQIRGMEFDLRGGAQAKYLCVASD